MSRPSKKKAVKEPLLDKHAKFQELSQKATKQLEILSGHIDTLEACKAELSKKERERATRKKMRDVAAQVNRMINPLTDMLKELKTLKFSEEKDKENKKKTMKRLCGYFSRQHDRFVQSLSTYQEKEKIFIQERVSLLSGGSSTSVLSGASRKYFESISDPGIQVAIEDIDYYQGILEERENYVHLVREIAFEMKLQAEDQQKAIKENQEDLEIMLHDASIAEKEMDDGANEIEEVEKISNKKRFGGAFKRNIAICLLVVIICGIVLIATLVTGTIKF